MEFFWYFPSRLVSSQVIINSTRQHSLFYNVSLQGLEIPLQAFRVHLDCLRCSENITGMWKLRHFYFSKSSFIHFKNFSLIFSPITRNPPLFTFNFFFLFALCRSGAVDINHSADDRPLITWCHGLRQVVSFTECRPSHEAGFWCSSMRAWPKGQKVPDGSKNRTRSLICDDCRFSEFLYFYYSAPALNTINETVMAHTGTFRFC